MKQFSVAVNKIEDSIHHVRSAGLIYRKRASQFTSDIKGQRMRRQSMARIF